MKINIKEKFKLIEKLESLKETLKDNNEVSVMCSKGIYEFKKGVNAGMLSSFVNTLNGYSWITEVANFIEDYNTFVTENTIGIKLEAILTSLENSQYRATYENAITELGRIIPLSEAEIKAEIHSLKNHSFIPAIRSLVEDFERKEFAVTKTKKAEVEKDHISPIMLTAEGYVFSLNGRNYEVNSAVSTIKTYEGKVTGEYQYALAALNVFKRENGNQFVLETKTGYVKIFAGEENRLFINETEVSGKDAINTALHASRVVDYFDKATKSVVLFMYENANKYATIDIVKNVKIVNENVKMSFIKLSNNKIYLNNVNNFEKRNELVEITAENYNKISEAFIKEFKLDIKPVLESIKVNIKAVKFAELVNSLDISKLAENTDAVFAEVKTARNLYENLDETEKLDCKESLAKLEEKEAIIFSEKVKFLIETRTKYVTSEAEGKEQIIEMLNKEIAEEVTNESTKYKVGDKVLVKDVHGKDKEGIIKELPSKSTDQYNIDFDGDTYSIMPNRIIKLVK